MAILLNSKSMLSLCLAAAASLVISQPAAANKQPTQELAIQPFKAHYDSAWDVGISFNGDLVRSLTKNANGSWVFTTKAKALIASISEESNIELINQSQVQPLHYVYKRKVLGKKKTADLSFNWAKYNVLDNEDNKPWGIKTFLGIQDKQSYQLQMRLDLKAGKKGPFVYQIADGGRIKTYTFKWAGKETIKLPTGETQAIRIERDRGPNSKRKTSIWFAPSMDYLVVKLKQVEKDGKEYVLELKSLETL